MTPKLRRWAKNSCGQTAVVFSLMVLPILAVSGFAVDASRQVSVKHHAQEAADAAAIAGARTFKSAFDATLAETTARHAFTVNIDTRHGDATCTIDDVNVDTTDLTVSVDVTCMAPTVFGRGISGKSTVKAEVTSTAEAIQQGADVVMMYDVSRSMNTAEIDQLKAAGKRAAEIVIGNQPGARGRVGIVPFAFGVNAGEFGNKATGRSAGDDPENDDRTAGGASLERVCVTERLGAEEFTDAAPTAGQHVGPVISPLTTTPAHLTSAGGSATLCPDSPIHPLDDRLDTVKTKIDGIKSSTLNTLIGGGTAGHMGVAWSWYLMSPNWASVWTDTDFGGDMRHEPLAYSDPTRLKVVILMTDGIFRHGFVNQYNVATPADYALATETLCQGMRDAGIIVYTVGYRVPSPGDTMLENCAGDPNRAFFASDASDLTAIYETISGRFLGIGLTQ